jgi:hypothetical protein
MGELSNFLTQIQNYLSHHMTAFVAAFLGYFGMWWHQNRVIQRMDKSLGSERDRDVEYIAWQTRIDISFLVMLLGITNGLLAAILGVLLYQSWR